MKSTFLHPNKDINIDLSPVDILENALISLIKEKERSIEYRSVEYKKVQEIASKRIPELKEAINCLQNR